MQKRSTIGIFILIGFVAPVLVYAGYLIFERKYQKLPVYGKTSTVNGEKKVHKIAGFEAINQDEEKISAEMWNNKIIVVDFFFTHCPSICPKMTNSLKRVQEAFGEEEIQITSFSVDPERDSTRQLKSYADKFGLNTNNWNLLTGDKREIYKLARNSFLIVATDGDGGPHDFIHSEKLVLVDKQRKIRRYYDGTSEKEVTMLIQDIKKLKHER